MRNTRREGGGKRADCPLEGCQREILGTEKSSEEKEGRKGKKDGKKKEDGEKRREKEKERGKGKGKKGEGKESTK